MLLPNAVFVRFSTVTTAKSQFLVPNFFSMSAFVDLAAAVSTNFKAGFQCNTYQFGEAFEQLL
jgi:hypothetical protein